MNTKPKMYLHGECKIIQRNALPEGCLPKNVDLPFLIVADSETTGNHHVVETGTGVNFFDQGGTIWMVNEKPTNVKCVHADRHDTIEIPSGTWEFGTQKEYDYFTEELRNVRD
jgi:hypothetical protein